MVRNPPTREELLDEIARLRRTVARLTGQTTQVAYLSSTPSGAARFTPRPVPSEGVSMVDNLTRAYNRPAFVTIANQRLKAITRREVPTTLLTFGLEDATGLSARLGEETVDDARRAAGTLLRETFRESDLIGRLDDDTFAVLAVDAAEDTADQILGRFGEVLEGWNSSSAKAPYRLTLAVRRASYAPGKHLSVEDLLADAKD
ncbi:MAG: diguanylate cyclase [Pseudomonadota bacterium]